MDTVEDALQLASFNQLVQEINSRCSHLLIVAHGLPGTPPTQSKLVCQPDQWLHDVAKYLVHESTNRKYGNTSPHD